MLNVRKATLDDAESFARIAEETFRSTFSAANSVEDMNLHCRRNFGKELQQREISDQNMVTLLCEDQKLLVGFAQLCWQENPSCLSEASLPGEIRRLYVIEDFHGRGVAQILMDASIDKFAKRGSDLAWLGVWESNPRAIAFYRKYNFAEVGEHEFYLGDDPQRDVIMSRLLKTGT